MGARRPHQASAAARDRRGVATRRGRHRFGPGNKQVRLANGDQVPFDRLLIATGTRARPWFNPKEAALEGVFTLRTRMTRPGCRRRWRPSRGGF